MRRGWLCPAIVFKGENAGGVLAKGVRMRIDRDNPASARHPPLKGLLDGGGIG
jgi:hypothetical protein